MKNNFPFVRTVRQAQIQAQYLVFSNVSFHKMQLETIQKNEQLIMLPKVQV